MKKFLLVLFCLSFISATALAQSRIRRGSGQECVYHPLQEKIIEARSPDVIKQLLNDKINLNMKFRCGGSILQLAVRRGNPYIVQTLLEEARLNPNEVVSNAVFPIPDAPQELPILLFAAYYSPRPDILKLFLNAGADVLQQDKNGENVLWYIAKNPVLSNTELHDQIIKNVLLAESEKMNQSESRTEAHAQPKVDVKIEEDITEKAAQQQIKKPVQQPVPAVPDRPNFVRSEPQKTFKPVNDNSPMDLTGSSF